MPKKAKGKKKDKGPEEPKTEFDEHTVESLEELIPQMKDKLKDLSMKRNYFQLERDTIDGFRTMSEKEVRRLEGLSKLRDLELEEIMENQRVELEVYAHKVRHLKYETDVDVSKVRAEADRVVSENHASYRSKVERAEKGKVASLSELEDNAEIAHDAIANMMASNELELKAVKEKHAAALAAFKDTCRQRMKELVENLDIQKRVELQEIEDRKNLHLQTLMQNHEAAFGEMRDYYQGITADNCGLIQRYEAELADLRTNQLRNADLLTAASNENSRLRAPLATIMAEVSHLRSSLSEVEKIKLMLRNATGRLKDSGRRRDTEVRIVAKLKQRLANCEKRREALYKDFETSILALQSKTDRKNLMLAKRLDGYEAEAEGCEAKIEQMVTAMELDKTEVLDVLRHTASALQETEVEANEAEFAIARGVKVFNETLRAFQEKMQTLGIPEEEIDSIGFDLLPEPVGGASTQPSGLIAAPFNASQTMGSTQQYNASQSFATPGY